MSSGAGRQRLQFGAFEFDPAAGELYGQGQRVELQEQPRQLLAALLERPGEIATREELRERLWKTDTFVDFEHGLNTAIKKVRRALGDSADAPQFIETLARRGYRFIAPVSAPAATAAIAGIAPQLVPELVSPSPPDTHRRRHRVAWWGGVAIVVLVAAAAAWQVQRRARTASPEARVPAVTQLAVMPLRVLGGPEAGDWGYVGVGIADAITTRLANIQRLGLRPTSAVLPYKDAQPDPATIAAALGVRYLLLGTIQRTNETYRISVQLVDANGVAVWGRSYDEPAGGLLQLQDRIAEQVVGALQVELSPRELAGLQRRSTQDPAAYDLYLRGRALLVNYTDASMREAMSYFERAIALDDSYALAHAGLATGAAWFSVRYAYEAEAMSWGKRADAAAMRALQQDPGLAEAHLAIASVAGTLYGGFNWKLVMERTATALRLDPSLDLAHGARMRALYHLGLFDEAREEERQARALNPSPGIETLRLEAAVHLFGGEFNEAALRSLALVPQTDAPAVRQYLGLARYYLGDAPGARETLGAVVRRGHPDVRAQASLASVEAATNLREAARQRADGVARGAYMDHHVAYSLGAAYAQLGEAQESVKWLQQAADTGFPCYPWFERDPLLEPVRRHPTFIRLVESMRAASRQFVTGDTSPGTPPARR